jgi:aspartate/glutamate racemase
VSHLWKALILVFVTSPAAAGLIPLEPNTAPPATLRPENCAPGLDENEVSILGQQINEVSRPNHFPVSVSIHIEDEVKKLIATYGLEKGKDASDTIILLRLLPQNWRVYVALQEKIADLIPQEEHRPTIDLTLTHSSAAQVKKSIGIAGGTGPLSDAELLKSVMSQLETESPKKSWDEFAINLFSAPPPRSLGGQWHRGMAYGDRLMEFATRGHDKYYMASNTAHLHLNAFKDMIALTLFRFGIKRKKDAAVDLAQAVVNRANATTDPERTPQLFVFGTLEAYKAQLYPNYFIHNEIPKSRYATVSTLARATELQAYIDLAKGGTIAEAGRRMKALILEEVREELRKTPGPGLTKKNRVIRIILGCTEIPMALHGPLLAELERELSEETHSPVELIDSESVFADQIVGDVDQLL